MVDYDDREPYKCLDCQVDTSQRTGISEYYMVLHRLWSSVVLTSGMLCIGCLEKRLGRKLKPADFLPCPLNETKRTEGSKRLQSRLKGTDE